MTAPEKHLALCQMLRHLAHGLDDTLRCPGEYQQILVAKWGPLIAPLATPDAIAAALQDLAGSAYETSDGRYRPLQP